MKKRSKFLKVPVIDISSPIGEVSDIRISKDLVICYRPVSFQMYMNMRLSLEENFIKDETHRLLLQKNPDHPAFGLESTDPELQMAALGIEPLESYKVPDFNHLTEAEEKRVQQLASIKVGTRLPPNLSTANLIIVKGLYGPESVEQFFTPMRIEVLDNELKY